VDRAARRLAVEKEKEKKDAEKPELTRVCELGKPWRSVVRGRQEMGFCWSRRRRRLRTTTMMMMMTTKTTTWRPDLASVRTRGWNRDHRASLEVGWHHQCLGQGHQGPGPRSGGRPRGYLTPWPR
jgi:hypothetical protein